LEFQVKSPVLASLVFGVQRVLIDGPRGASGHGPDRETGTGWRRPRRLGKGHAGQRGRCRPGLCGGSIKMHSGPRTERQPRIGLLVELDGL